MRYAAAMLSVAVCAGMTACSPNSSEDTGPTGPSGVTPAATLPSETPEQVAERMMDAIVAADEAAFKATLTHAAREALESGEAGDGFTGEDYQSYEIGAAVIEADEATVSVEAVKTDETEKMNLKMRNEDNAWRVYALGIILGPDSEMTLNLERLDDSLEAMAEGLGEMLVGAMEEAFSSAFQPGGDPKEIALKLGMFDALGPVTAAEFESTWRIGENYAGTARLEALKALAKPIGLSVYAGDHADALSEPVTTDTAGMSRLEAIERIANEAGLHSALPDLQDFGIMESFMGGLSKAFTALIGTEDSLITLEGKALEEYQKEFETQSGPAENAITFEAGEPSPRVQFHGPFRLALAAVEENPPHATGSLQLSLRAYGMPPAVLAMLEENDEGFQIHAVEDVNGAPLIDMSMSYFGGGQAVGNAFTDHASRDLLGLLQSVDRIARVSGAVSLVLPSEVGEVEFTTLEPGVSKSVGDLRLTVDDAGTNTNIKVSGPGDAVKSLVVLTQPYGADGEAMGVSYSDYQSWREGEGTININTESAPTRIRMKLVTKTERLEYPFEMKDILLVRADEQPEALAELDFSGNEAPLKLTFIEVTEPDESFAKVKIRIENVSNKPVKSAFVEFVYRDASGAELNTMSSTLNGEFSAEGWAPLAAVGASIDTEQTAFQMPKDAVSMDFRFHHVEFMDGTRWEPED